MFRVTFEVTGGQFADVERVLQTTDEVIKHTAIKSRNIIVEQFHQPKSGNLYRKNGRLHRASAPGEAPAYETGLLERAIHVRQNTDGYDIVVDDSMAPYAKRLEFGMPGATYRKASSNYAIEIDESMGERLVLRRPFMTTRLLRMANLFVQNVYDHLAKALK